MKTKKKTSKTSKPEANPPRYRFFGGKFPGELLSISGFNVKGRYIKDNEADPIDQAAFDDFMGEGVKGWIPGFDIENRGSLRQGAGLYDSALELAMDYCKTFALPIIKLETLYRRARDGSERKKIVNRFLSAIGLLRLAKGKKPRFDQGKVTRFYAHLVAELSRGWGEKNGCPDGGIVAVIAGNKGVIRYTGANPQEQEAHVKKIYVPVAAKIVKEAVKITQKTFGFSSTDACARYLRETCKLKKIPDFRP